MVLQWSVEFGTLLCHTLSYWLAAGASFSNFCGPRKARLATSQDQSEFLV